MVKQKLEGIFSKSLKERKDLWYIKLQVNPLAHTKSPADYIVLSNTDKKYLIECKQVDLRKNPKNRYTFDRLTQERDLYLFKKRFEKNGYAYVCLLFLEKFIKKSHFYLIPIDYYIYVKNICNKKSLNHNDIEKYFKLYRLRIKKDILRLISIK